MGRIRISGGFAFLIMLLAGCAADGYSSSSSVSVGYGFYYGHSWYDNPYYWYGDPDYIVVPPDRPGEPGRPARPEHPIANPPAGNRPETLPAPAPSARPAPTTSGTSRMPSARPHMSSPSSRASIPRASRGGGMRRR